MKKILTIVLITLIGVFIYINRPRTKVNHLPDSNMHPRAIITLEEIDDHDLEYSDVEKIMTPLIELGYMHIEINNFQWIYYCTGCCPVPHYEDSESIVLKRHDVEFDRLKDMPTATEQYDMSTILSWCKKHSGKHATVQFEDNVRFNVIEAVTQSLFEYDIQYFLMSNIDEDSGTDITIGLYQRHKPKELPEMPNQALQPTPLDAGSEIEAQGGAAEL